MVLKFNVFAFNQKSFSRAGNQTWNLSLILNQFLHGLFRNFVKELRNVCGCIHQTNAMND